MKWEEIRHHYPHQWLLIEAIQAHSASGQRVLDQIAVLETFDDSSNALKRYAEFHQDIPERELYVLHTDREQPNITERKWLGIRGI